jgi:hypothetical protein
LNLKQFRKLVEHRPDVAKTYRFVPAGGFVNEGYWRKKRKKYDRTHVKPRSLARTHLEFTEITMSVYDRNLHGLKDGLPVAAAEIKEKMTGRRFKLSRWKEAILKFDKAREKRRRERALIAER